MRERQVVLALLAVFALNSARLGAQDRITIRMVPAPNQTLHFRNTQETNITTETETAGPADAPPRAPMLLSLHTVVDVTSAIGPTDQRGHYLSRMTIDNITLTGTQDGKPMPTPPEVLEAGKHVIIFSYDDQGKVTDVSFEGPPTPAATEGLAHMMKSAFATVAPMTLSVGESVTVPATFTLPIAGGGAGTNMSGDTRYTLTSITFDGADRIAHLASHSANTVKPASPGTPGMTMTTTSDGALDVNVDRGIVIHFEQRTRIENAMPTPAAGGRRGSTMRMRGTFSSVSDLAK